MKTEHLDNEIERLILMERTKDLSEYGQDMLNEFRAIKQALTIPVVVGRSEQLFCRDCKYNKCKSYGDQMYCRDCRQMDRYEAK